MPGDPKECRMHAANCRALAAQATSSSAKETFTSLAEHWDRLESAQNFLKAMADLEAGPKPDADITKDTTRPRT
jgi:hypothetical protein